jgi:hypothetical protein
LKLLFMPIVRARGQSGYHQNDRGADRHYGEEVSDEPASVVGPRNVLEYAFIPSKNRARNQKKHTEHDIPARTTTGFMNALNELG